MLIACKEIGQPVRIAPSQARNRIFRGAERLRVHGSGEDHGPIHIRMKRAKRPMNLGQSPDSRCNSSTLFTTETRSTRRCTEKPDASVKSPCAPCLSGETGHVAAAGSLSELQLDKTRPSVDTPIDRRWERDRLLLICYRERWTCSFCESWPAGRRTATASPNISRASPKTCFRWEKAHSTRHYSDSCSTAG